MSGEPRGANQSRPVFAFSHDLGNVQGDEVETVFTLGLVQRQLIYFAGLSGKLEPVPSLLEHYFNDEISSVNAFSEDYHHASEVSDDLDNQIHIDSVNAAGSDYSLITTLALRQTFGGLQFAGTPEKPYIFLKEISSNSDIQTVDVIFPAYPIFMYLNATLSKYLLDPIFENQESGAYPNDWAEHDLGTFPVAQGYPKGDDEAMPLEECGNMIIMTLAYVQRTGDIDYIKDHYALLRQWAQYLLSDSLIPSHQLSTDDFAGPLVYVPCLLCRIVVVDCRRNQTNLAIKGIIGLRAMGEIAKLTGNDDQFSAKAEAYLEEWRQLAINRDAEVPHTTLSYGNKNSHGTPSPSLLSFVCTMPNTPPQESSTTSTPTASSRSTSSRRTSTTCSRPFTRQSPAPTPCHLTHGTRGPSRTGPCLRRPWRARRRATCLSASWRAGSATRQRTAP